MDNELIETRPFEVVFYEFIEASPQRIDIKREWMVIGNEDYFIQTIPQ